MPTKEESVIYKAESLFALIAPPAEVLLLLIKRVLSKYKDELSKLIAPLLKLAKPKSFICILSEFVNESAAPDKL